MLGLDPSICLLYLEKRDTRGKPEYDNSWVFQTA